MKKEYTYDIGKYTIGVDENGEDGIGLTVAIIEDNGMIRFLGNCYGENARCLHLLIKENQELKKQLEVAEQQYNDLIEEKENLQEQLLISALQLEELKLSRRDYTQENVLEMKMTKLETQQKEFIKYLENEIYNIEPKGTGINYNCEYDSEEDYVSAMQEQSRLNTLKEILQKYKEIIGVSDDY